MGRIKIFVEGKGDIRFLTDYIFRLTTVKPKQETFVNIGGCTYELIEPNRLLFTEGNLGDIGGTNLIIFDANGDYAKKKAEILSWKQKLNIEFELFLFPNDNDYGNLETLLENISLPEHKIIFDCFDKYQECIGVNKNYSLPNQKAKNFAYTEAILSKSKSEEAKENKRNYLDTTLWNLNGDYMEPLKDFLLTYL